jgi:hypothetical protein
VSERSAKWTMAHRLVSTYSEKPKRSVEDSNYSKHVNCTVESNAFCGFSERCCVEQLLPAY